jgi:hypothetical protein
MGYPHRCSPQVIGVFGNDRHAILPLPVGLKKGNSSRILIILTFYTLREIERSGLRVEAIPNPPNVATPCYTLENLFPDWSFQKKTNRCEVHYEV